MKRPPLPRRGRKPQQPIMAHPAALIASAAQSKDPAACGNAAEMP
jgi:hypothetical protein